MNTEVVQPQEEKFEPVSDVAMNAMEAGYSGTKPDAAPAEAAGAAAAAQPEPKNEPAPAAAAPAAAAPKDAPLTLDSIKGLINESLRPVMGAVGDQGSRLKKLSEEIKAFTPANVAAASAAAKEVGGAAPTQSQVQAAMQSTEKMKALKEDFPDFAAALEEQAANLEKNILGKLPKAEKVDLSGYVPRTELEAMRQEVFDVRVSQKHPNYEADVNTPEFAQWYAKQDADTQKLGESLNPADGIKFMDKFYEHKKTLTPAATQPAAKPSNQSRLREAAVTPQKGGAPAAKSMTVEQAMEAGYKAYS